MSLLDLTGTHSIEEFEENTKELSTPVQVNHLFSEDQYVREIIVPKDTIVTGKRHKKETINILLEGSCIIYNEYGKKEKEMIAPFTFVSAKMTKKVAVFLEDSVWLNVHATKETDFDKLEKELYAEEDVGRNFCQNYDGTLRQEYLECQQ